MIMYLVFIAQSAI